MQEKIEINEIKQKKIDTWTGPTEIAITWSNYSMAYSESW